MKNPQIHPNLRSSSHTETSSLIAFGAVVLIIASLYWAQSVLVPIALSIMLTFLLSPVATALERTGLGRLPSIILIVLLTFSLLATVGWVVAIEFTSLGNELPKYTDNIRQKISDVRGAGKGGALENVQKAIEQVKEEIQKKEEPRTNKEKTSQVIVQPQESSRFWPIPLVSTAMLEPLAAAGLVIVLVVFMLVQREDLRNRLIRLVGYSRLTVTTQAMEEAGQRISRYLLMQTIINSSFGLAVGMGLYFIGLPYAIVWGFLATVLRFIPYVGTFAAAIMPTALSLAVFQGWLWPIFVVGLFSVLELLNNMVLEPLLYSESAGVSGVGLLVAIAFWTWLWGPVGLVLATPLTVCVVVLAKYVPWMDFIGVLMSDQPAMQSNISYYQRLLAMDQAEAAEIAEEHLKNHPREQIFDAVLIPALSYARRDCELGRLTEDGEQFVFRATREIVEDLNSLMPESSPDTPDSVKAKTIVENNSLISPKNCILGCPARDEADELALHMLTQLFDATRYEVEVMSDALLASEIVGLIADRSPAVVLIATVSRGGMMHARYLCKRLRARFPHLKIVIGRWGLGSEDSNSVALAGADRVGTTLIETRDQIIRLSQISLHPDAPQSSTTVPSLSPLDSDVFAEASA
jgi:predicted PurR-regulated permease PerM